MRYIIECLVQICSVAVDFHVIYLIDACIYILISEVSVVCAVHYVEKSAIS